MMHLVSTVSSPIAIVSFFFLLLLSLGRSSQNPLRHPTSTSQLVTYGYLVHAEGRRRMDISWHLFLMFRIIYETVLS